MERVTDDRPDEATRGRGAAMTSTWTGQLRRLATQCLIGAAGLAALTFICFHLGLGIGTTAFVYMGLIVLLSWWGGFGSSVVLSLAAAACLDYFFAAPVLDFKAALPSDIVLIVVFSVLTTLLVAGLVGRARAEAAAARKAEGRALAAEGAVRQVFDFAPHYVIVLGPDGERTRIDGGPEINQTALDFHGLSLDDWRRTDPRSLFHPDDWDRLERENRRFLPAGAGHETEARLRRADGAYRWFLIRYSPDRDAQGRIARWYLAATDIEDRRRAELALKRSEAYQAEAQQLSHTGSFGWVVASGEVFWSEEAFAIFGYPPAPLASLEMIFARIHPDDLDRVRRTIDEAASSGRDFGLEHRLKLPDGTVKHVHVVARAFGGEAGQAEFVGAIMDVTERRRAEAALHQARADLAHVSRVNIMGELTATLAHEINQPITAAVTNANACLRFLAGETPDLAEAREAAQSILVDGRRAADIINRTREFFRKGVPEMTPVDIDTIAGETVRLLTSEAARYAIAIRTDLAAAGPPAMGDPVQLQQVLMNLIMNSIDAVKDIQDVREIAVETHRGGAGEVVVSVADTGVGLPAQQAGEVFDPFFTTKSHGTGMGLSISRSIIDAHGGRLWAAANAPRGARFSFTLPPGAPAAPSAG